MRYLLSSTLLVLFVSCASYPKKKEWKAVETVQKIIVNPYFSDETKDYVYKASIDAFDKSFGGIFIVKKLGDQYHRIVFTTEMGNKIFDFTYQGENFKVNHILKEMDKPLLINILKNDFRVLVSEKLTTKKGFIYNDQSIFKTEIDHKKYYHILSKKKLQCVLRIRNRKEKVEFLFSEINDHIAEKIQISHKIFDLNINLQVL